MRRSRWPLFALAGLLVLLALGVAADRIGARYATTQLRARVATATGSTPQVSAPGAFLPQALARRFRTVDLSLPSVRLEKADLSVNDVRANLRDVPWESTGRIGAIDATGVVPFAELERRAGLPVGSLSAAGDGRVRVAQKLEVFGISLPVAATADLRLDGEVVAIDPAGLEVAGSPIPLNDELRNRITGQLRGRVPLAGLPAGMRAQDVAVTPDGLRLHIVGQDVAVAELDAPG